MKKNYSSRSAYASPRSSMFSSSVPPPITEVKVDRNLLTPINLELDPNIYNTRIQEKEQIKTLNDRFASFIEKVRILEQQNKVLETKWSLLQDQTGPQPNLTSMYDDYVANLRRQLDHLMNNKEVLERELVEEQKQVEDYKAKYENEINKRTDAENEFVLLKKDVDAAYMNKVELEAKRDSLEDELHFLYRLHETELDEVHSQIKEINIVLEMDNTRNLEMDNIVAEVRSQYEGIAKRSRAEAETWYEQKFEEMETSAIQHNKNLRSNKAKITDMNRLISRLRNEIDSLKVQNCNLQGQLDDVDANGDEAVNNAAVLIRNLEEALQQAKQNMARQVREYQDLMNLKLALDIEIATYRKLLEGEEFRLASGGAPVNVQMQPNRRH